VLRASRADDESMRAWDTATPRAAMVDSEAMVIRRSSSGFKAC